MSALTKPQTEVLALHRGTNYAKPRCNPMDFRKFDFPSHPTAMALRNRRLLDWRGYDGDTAGGWFITDAGTAALSAPEPRRIETTGRDQQGYCDNPGRGY